MKALLVVLAVVGLHSVTAHTWIDCFDTNYTKIYDDSASYIYGGSSGNGFCDGYGAGYPGRGDTNIGTEYTFKMLENEVEAGTDVCQTVDADTYTSTDWRKRISVTPGQTVYFAYLPNGHIVKDKKAIGTQHGIYWTGQVGTSLTSTLDMTAENLMDGHTLDFDDGNCGESVDMKGNPGGRAGDGKPCIGTFLVPTGTAAGVYSMVWYWTFWLDNEASYVDQAQARGYFGAAYSTCFEVEVTSGSGSSTAVTEAPSTDAPQVTTATPQSTSAAPQPTTASPAVTTATPTNTAPVATTEAPASTTSTPEATSAASWDQVDAVSAAGDADSTAITSAPPVSTSAPISTTSAPQVTTAAPDVATAAPVVATAAPVGATAAPVVTPVVTQTEAPVATSPPVQLPATEAPAQTTSAPQATTSAPVAVTAAPVTRAQTTSSPAVTDAPTTEAPSTPETTVAAPTATPETDTTSAAGSDEPEDGYSSLNSATFSSLNGDDASAGTVHAASLGSSSSTSYSSSSADNSVSSDSRAAEVGSGSFATEPEVSYDSASASEGSPTTTVSPSSASSSTASASTNAETSFAPKSWQSQSWLVLLCVFIAAVVV